MAKILIVDDSSLSRRMLRRILESAGHEVQEAGDGIAALEQYFLEHSDLVLLDMTMAGMHGMEVLSKLRELDPKARVIVATADIQSSTKVMVKEKGASGFLSKPFDSEAVLGEVDKVLATAS
jgi:two-component system, chemotaxis family, chemotaxis protein CheY